VTRWVTISHVTTWMAVAILAREILITSLRGVYEAKGVSFAATPIGKWKMILQSVCVPLVLLLPNVPFSWGRTGERDWVDVTLAVVVWATVIVSVWSGVPYVMRAIRESGKLSEGKA
jgi:CDP-diacylglycerol--glycerol-3-phosphate 3-phosphatidyltransferase